jgi:hypothetical protein
MPSSSVNSHPDLKYPPVRVNRSLAQLDLGQLMMRSTTRRQPHETGSALDDSCYDYLGDSAYEEVSDDEAHTESLASTEGLTPDDGSTFSDDDDEDYGRGNEDMEDSVAESTPLHHQLDPQPIFSAEDSTLTEVPGDTKDGADAYQIKLHEDLATQPGVILGSKIIRRFPDEDDIFPAIFQTYECSQVRVVVKAALSQECIPAPDSYNILYIGMPEPWLEKVISNKIRAALTVRSGISRSTHVSDGPRQDKPDMHVYRCTTIHDSVDQDQQSSLEVSLDDGKQLTFGSGRLAAFNTRPDLVIFCHPKAPESTPEEWTRARAIFDREQVPYLNMAEVRQYKHGASSYDLKSLSVCIEGRNDLHSDFELQEVLSLDSNTFNDLEPSQLNRHLALISPQPAASRASIGKGFKSISHNQKWKGYAHKFRTMSPAPAKTLLMLVALTGMISAYVLGPLLFPMLFERRSNIEVQSSVSAPVWISAPTTAAASSSVTSPVAISITSATSVHCGSRGLTIVSSQAQRPKQAKKKEKFTGFDIITTADHQFTLKPREDIANSRKKPQLQIQVVRQSKAIPIRYNRTISGDYVVDLEQSYPFGMFNVSIASYSKPLLQQSFEIALGHNKSEIAQYLDLVALNMVTAQDYVLNVSTMAYREVLASLPALEATARTWTNEAQESVEDVTFYLHDAIQAIPEAAKTIPKAAWMEIRKATAPVRTSSPMLRARLNALRVRCQFEMATGLSRTDGHGKQTGACAKLRSQA